MNWKQEEFHLTLNLDHKFFVTLQIIKHFTSLLNEKIENYCYYKAYSINIPLLQMDPVTMF